MKIKTLSYRDNAQKWYFEDINFFDLTLLVGASGVGKTQILSAILGLKEIGNGESLNGIAWNITFDIGKNQYSWKGEFELIEDNNIVNVFHLKSDNHKLISKVKHEYILLNNELIAKREDGQIEFSNEKMPKLSSVESLVNIFREEERINIIYREFEKIIFKDHTVKASNFMYKPVSIDGLAINDTFKKIKENDLLTSSEKLFCLYENDKIAFNKIVDNYKDIFPQISDVRITPFRNNGKTFSDIDFLNIEFKEEGVNRWIHSNQMSSGMLRTFLHIAEMYLLKDGTIVLIDEFENSLGVNCINVLTEDLIYENGRLQFIATSHHPYIINKIPYKYWKIVTRKGGEIRTNDANDFDLGASNHERFLNLINLPQYKYGIESIA
jgi:predicted ATPase